MTDLLIRDVRLASGSSADLGIQGSRLVDPGSLVNPRIIDASGLIALPGLVDLHTHLRQPSPQPAETIASGTAAAARGGFTAVFAMANTDPVTDTADKVRRMRHLATGASSEVVPVGAVTQGLRGTHLAEIEAMCAAGVRVFSDDGRCVMDAHLMREALHITGRHDAVIAQHSQDHDLAGATAYQPDADPGDCADWPWAAEAVIVARDTQLALDTGARVHVCHVSTAESVEVLRWAKARRIPITAEVTPHHLLLDTVLLADGDTTFKVNPPLRHAEDRQFDPGGVRNDNRLESTF